jgi:prevent-host-death family protein
MHYQEVSAFDAKTHLSQLLTKVENGESFTITRHKHPIATLSPVANIRSNESQKKAIKELLEFSKGNKLGGISIKEMIEEGRR